MSAIRISLFLCLISTAVLQATEKMTFPQLEEAPMLQKPIRIQIRGFLYETADHLLILADDPDLKSCCVGNASKRHRQVVVQGEVVTGKKYLHAITLEGDLTVDRGQDYPYHLDNATVIPQENSAWSLVAIIAVGLIALFVWRKTTTLR